MRISKQLLALAAMLAMCGLFLTSCGGSSATTINGISVPPEPDATQNNATLAGVDSNSNGVRDDVERKIAEKWPGNVTELMPVAINFQKVILNQNVTDVEDKSSFCILANSSIPAGELSDLILDNPDRYKSYANNVGIKTVWDCQ